MERPTKRGKKWRIRRYDEKGVRRSAQFPSFKEAENALYARFLIVEQIKAGNPTDRLPESTRS